MDTSVPNSLRAVDSAQKVAAEKRDLLARLLGRLAHEIRNPLSSLDIHVQLLQEDLAGVPPHISGPMMSRMGIIRGELHRLECIVERFLRLAGPSEIDPEPAVVENMIKQVCDLLRPEAESRGIRLSTDLQLVPKVMADPVRLLQALLNLVINAMQAVGPQGEVAISLYPQSDAIVISVADNGHGIPPDKLGSVFDLYFTTKEEGHGLGLWVAQQIVTAHQGKLEARNRPGGGAVFTLILPAISGPATHHANEQ